MPLEAVNKMFELGGYFIAGTLAFYLSEKRKEWKAKKAAVAGFSPEAEQDIKINNLLSQLLFAVHGDKAKIFRFHNGGHYFNGTSIKKFSLTHLQLRPGVAGPTHPTLKDLTSSLFPHMMSALLASRNSVLHWRTEEAPDAYLKGLHAAEGTEFTKIAAVRNAHGELLGFLSVNWLNDQPPDDPVRRDLMLRFARDIGIVIN
jgi:hypothetical protein